MSDHFVGFRKLVSQVNKDSFVFSFAQFLYFGWPLKVKGLKYQRRGVINSTIS